ncbi:autophagy- protein 2 [Rhodotorula mucilaginosa]|uniref:Autophagy-related protein 2 n=1 Tax=Rhodotorula mucilaginosa TaxID=5537 RepID=A0A9P6VY56_RHOMI|nr:autophagy- protein 2 [Rhodotorula mucilaginosa]
MPWDSLIAPLASAATYLPALPSVPIPAKLQQRLVAFLLRRTIGRFVKGGGHSLGDEGRIEADVRNGRVVVRDVEIDDAAINSLLSPTSDTDASPYASPIRFEKGTVKSITTLIAWPLSRFDIVADEIELEFRIASSPTATPTAAYDSSPSPHLHRSSSDPEGHASEHSDDILAESHVSLAIAHDFVSHELLPSEDAELRASLHLSPSSQSQSVNLPGAFGGAARDASNPATVGDSHVEEVEATMLAGVIEKLLARLGVTAHNLRVRLLWSSSAPSLETASEHELELCVERIDFRGGVDEEMQSSAQHPAAITKRITIAPAKLYLHSRSPRGFSRPSSQEAYGKRPSRRPSSRSSSSASSASSSEDEHDLMAMSQSVADLRMSAQTSGTASRNDLFASATSQIFESVVEEPEEDDDDGRPDSPFVDPDAPACSTAPPSAETQVQAELLAMFGAVEPIVFELSSKKPDTSTPARTGVQISGRLGDAFSVALRPEHLRLFLTLADQMSTAATPPASGASAPSVATTPAPSRRNRPGAQVSIVLPSLRIVLANRYGTPIPESFWSRSSTANLANPHLRLSVDQITVSGQQAAHSGIELTAKAVTITEAVLLEDDSLRVSPILVSDADISTPKLLAWPDLDILSADWVVTPHQQYGKDWRLLPRVVAEDRKSTKSRPPSGDSAERSQADTPQSIIRCRLGGHDGSHVDLPALHVFFDATILTRLNGLLDAVAHDGRSSSERTIPTQQPVSRNRAAPPQAPQDDRRPVGITCPLLRVEARCPAPRHLRDAVGDDDLLRGGRVVLDFCEVDITLAPEAQKVQTREIRAFLVPAQASRGHIFLAISTLEGDGGDQGAYRPSLTFSPPPAYGNATQPPRLDINFPLLRVSLDKRIFDSLQLLADDVTQYLAKEVSLAESGSAAQWSSNNKMIGSRFFGTKSYMHPKHRTRGTTDHGHESETDSTASTVTMMADEPRTGARANDGSADPASMARPTLQARVMITDVILDVRLDPREDSAGGGRAQQLLSVKADDLSVDLETLVNGDDNLRLKLAVMDCIVLQSWLGSGESTELLRRTLGRSPTERPSAVLKVDFTSSTEPETSLKESRLQLGLSNLTACAGPDIKWIDELLAFVEAPEGAFEEVVPNELLKLRVRLNEISIKVSAPTLPSAVVLVIGDARMRSDLMPDLPRSIFHADLDRSRVLAIAGEDDLHSGAKASKLSASEIGSSWRYWRVLGYVPIAELATLTAQVRVGNGLVLPDLEVLLERVELALSLCADTAAALAAFVDDLQHWLPQKSDLAEVAKPRPNASRQASNDLLASVDSAAFNRAPTFEDSPIKLDDDVPVNGDYLAEALRQTRPSRTAPHPIRLKQSESHAIVSDVDGETIKMLAPDGLQIVDGWLDHARVEETALSAYGARIRARVSDANVTLRLYEGFDWANTRKAIQERAKAVRRRLQKIRQLLASGQTPDASAEDASVVMFGSVQLGLPAGASDLPPKDLLAAIDQELEDSPETDGQSTTAASRQAASEDATQRGRRSASTNAKTGKRRRRLTRPASCAIEINLRGSNALFESFDAVTQLTGQTSHDPHQPPLLSRLNLDAAHLEILDNLQSSTWHKFLTELRPSDGGVVRPTGTSMLRVEMSTVRGEADASATQGEILLKAKIVPLRLYIDQDALDFLKAFGAFQATQQAPSTPEQTSHADETFYQRVEIMSVKLKVDYKPKRVDFNALRSGKTAELMNFFHFDGSEMTLRHLVVTGVSGTSTLSSLVQDIWTPDVKANQLADVVSGIAPLKSVVNVGSGVANLVLLPIEQYRRDGRIVRGLQRGAHAFAKQTTLEAIHTGAKLATGTQVILEQAEHVLGGNFARAVSAETIAATFSDDLDGQLSAEEASEEARLDARSRYANQPANLRQGVEGAYKSFGENLKDAAQTILAVPMEVYERSGEEGPVRAVVRAVPLAVLKPMIGASGAVSKALLGLRNSLDPQAQAGEVEDKYKPTTGSSSR